MTIMLCGPAEIAPGTCPECGGWLHAERRGGYTDGHITYCSETCITSAQVNACRAAALSHLTIRDLLCACPTCLAFGHPTPDELAEWATYLASRT